MKKLYSLVFISVIIFCVSIMTPLIGCKAETSSDKESVEESESVDKKAEPEFVIGNLLLGQTHPVHILRAESGIEAAEALGGEMIIKTSEGSLETAIAAIEAFIEQGVDAIIVDAPDPQGIIPAAQKAIDAGIIYVAGYSVIDIDDPLAISVAAMNVRSERLRAMLMASYHNYEGEFAFLAGLVGQKYAEDVVKGFYKGMYELMDEYPNLKIADLQYTGYDAVEAQKIVQNWITQYPNLKGISTCSDSILYAGMEELENNGMNDVTLWGHDGDMAALEYVRDGKWMCNYASPGISYNEWYLTRIAVDAIRGVDVPQILAIPGELIFTDEVAEIVYANGFPKDVIRYTPEEAIEGIEIGGGPVWGPGVENIDWQKFEVSKEELAEEDAPIEKQ